MPRWRNRPKGRIVTAVVLCSIALLSDAAQEMREPAMLDDRIVFSDGHELRVDRYRGVNQDPLEALKKREPVSISQQAILVKEWRRLLIVETQHLFEDETRKLSIYDYSGKLCGEPRLFFGEALVLQKVARIVLAQKSSHHTVRASYILSPDGIVLSTINQPPDVFQIEVTPDQQLVWMLSSHMTNGKPFVKASVINIEGMVVGEFDSYSEKKIEVNYGGNLYTIQIPVPQSPG